MTKQELLINSLEKEIGWTSSIGVTIPLSNAKVYHRVEKLKPDLLDNGFLRVQLILKLIAIVASKYDSEHVFKPSKVFTNDVEIVSFAELYEGISRNDITSIDNQVKIKNYFLRPDKIIVNGTVNLKISYVVHLGLDGVVTEFLSGAPVKGATVNARDIENNEIIATTKTNSSGRYFFKNLKPGIYLIEAHSESHKPEQKVSVVNARDTVNFSLHK